MLIENCKLKIVNFCRRQGGFAIFPLIILVTALAGTLLGTIAVQRQTRTEGQAQTKILSEPTAAPTPTPVPCDNTNPDHLCGGSLTVRAFVESQQCGSTGKESADTWIKNINSQNASVSFGYFAKDAQTEDKELTSGGAVNFQNFNYVPDSNYYNDEAEATYKYPEWVRIRGVTVAIRPCANQRGTDLGNRQFKRALTPSNFGSGDNYYWEIRFEKTGVVEPSLTPTPTATPSPTSAPNQCPAEPNTLEGKELSDCAGDNEDKKNKRPSTTTTDISNLDFRNDDPGSLKVSWSAVEDEALSIYRVAAWYYIQNEEGAQKGALTGWPNVIQVDKDTNQKVIPSSEFNEGAVSQIKEAIEAGKEVKISGVVRAIFSIDPDEPLEGKTGSQINDLCFCRSDYTEGERLPLPTPTATPTPGNGRTLQFDIQDKDKNGDDRQCWIVWREGPNGDEPENYPRCTARGDRDKVYSVCSNQNMAAGLKYECSATPNVDADGNLVGLETTLRLTQDFTGSIDQIKMMSYVCDNPDEKCQENIDYGDTGETLDPNFGGDPLEAGESFTCRWENPSKDNRSVSCTQNSDLGPNPTAIPTQSPTNTPTPINTPTPSNTPAPTPTPASNGLINGVVTINLDEGETPSDVWEEHKIWYELVNEGDKEFVQPENGASGGSYQIESLLVNQLYSVVVSSKHVNYGWLDSTQKRFVKPQADGRLITENGSIASTLDFTINPPDVEDRDEQGNGINGSITIINSDQNIRYTAANIEFFRWNNGDIEQVGRIVKDLTEESGQERVEFDYNSDGREFTVNNGTTYALRVVVYNQRGYFVAVTPHKVVTAPKADFDFEIELINVHSNSLRGIGDYFIYFVDVVLDGFINTKDYDAIVRTYGTCRGRADINSDGICNGVDLSFVIYNIGRQVEISTASSQEIPQKPTSVKILE